MNTQPTETEPVSATWLIGRADLLAQDARHLRELADRADELADRTRELGFFLLVHGPKGDTSEQL